jgi:hypothetical protein
MLDAVETQGGRLLLRLVFSAVLRAFAVSEPALSITKG